MDRFKGIVLHRPTEARKLFVEGIQYDKLLGVQAIDRYNLSSVDAFLRNIPDLSYNVLWSTLTADKYLNKYSAQQSAEGSSPG